MVTPVVCMVCEQPGCPVTNAMAILYARELAILHDTPVVFNVCQVERLLLVYLRVVTTAATPGQWFK